MAGIPEILNLQPRGQHAKPYQVKQVRNIIVNYRLAEQTHETETTRESDEQERQIESSPDDDAAYIAEVPELPGCAADGSTYHEALKNVEFIIEEWIATAKELGRPIPKPRGRLMFA